jgi:hypothetical protein
MEYQMTGEELKQWRKKLGLDTGQLGWLLYEQSKGGLYAHISRFERGERPIPPEIGVAVRMLAGVELEEALDAELTDSSPIPFRLFAGLALGRINVDKLLIAAREAFIPEVLE